MLAYVYPLTVACDILGLVRSTYTIIKAKSEMKSWLKQPSKQW